MRVLVFGATGGTGRLFVERARRAGLDVTAFVRVRSKVDLADGVKVLVGDARDLGAVKAAVKGHDAIVCLLGPTGRQRLRRFVAKAVKAMVEAAGPPERIILVSAVGVGDSRPEAPRFVRWFVAPLLLRTTYADRAEAERILLASDADWTILRPTYLTDNAADGYAFATSGRDVDAAIPRAALAQALVDELAARRYVRTAIAVGGAPPD